MGQPDASLPIIDVCSHAVYSIVSATNQKELEELIVVGKQPLIPRVEARRFVEGIRT